MDLLVALELGIALVRSRTARTVAGVATVGVSVTASDSEL